MATYHFLPSLLLHGQFPGPDLPGHVPDEGCAVRAIVGPAHTQGTVRALKQSTELNVNKHTRLIKQHTKSTTFKIIYDEKSLLGCFFCSLSLISYQSTW